VGQERVRPTSEHGRHPFPLYGQPGTADRIDALVDSIESPAFAATLNSAFSKAERHQLAALDHPMLLIRNPSDRPIDAFWSPTGRFPSIYVRF
jgi:hypothetical protein